MQNDVLKTARSIHLLVVFFLFSGTIQAQYRVDADTSKTSLSFGQFAVIGDFSASKYQNNDPDLLQSYMQVRVKGSSVLLFGNYLLSSDSIIFTPRFSPDPTITYEVTFSSEELDTTLRSEFIFRNTYTPTKLLRVSPSDSLPSNALRIYLHFNQPMGLQNPFNFIHLLNEKGDIIKDAFVEYKEGLWNHNRTRLTLLFHPGRIKQGVGLNTVMGPIFHTGKRYQLIITQGWKDQNGISLINGHSISWNITEDIRTRIDPNLWKIKVPQNLSDSLVISGDRIIDEEIFKRLAVIKKDGRAIQGRWKVAGQKYIFINSTLWNKGEHQIVISQNAEDVSGNTLSSAFDPGEKINVTSGGRKVLTFYVL